MNVSLGFSSYPQLFFTVDQVINNTWFAQTTSAQNTAAAWAAELSAEGPWSVINKTLLPASNQTQDYYSLAVYWWPNCSNVDNTTELTEQQISDECNYYQRDGIFNPDTNLVMDHEGYDNLTDSVYLDALAYVATGSSMYSSHINSVISTWFVDNATSMNPQLEYAQVHRGPGNATGAHEGVLDGKGLVKLVSAVQVMRASGAAEWEAATDAGLVTWSKSMANWLATSDLALGEKAAANNHGTFYFNQLCALYAFVNDNSSAISELEWFYNNTYPAQIAANGDQPLESSRTRPFHYRAYNLAALVANAQIGDVVGLSPSAWNRTTSAGATILDALNYAMAQNASASGEADVATELNPTIAIIASKYGDPTGKYAAYLNSTDPQYMSQPYYALSSNLSYHGTTNPIKANSTTTTSGSGQQSGALPSSAAAQKSAAQSSRTAASTVKLGMLVILPLSCLALLPGLIGSYPVL